MKNFYYRLKRWLLPLYRAYKLYQWQGHLEEMTGELRVVSNYGRPALAFVEVPLYEARIDWRR